MECFDHIDQEMALADGGDAESGQKLEDGRW